MPQQPDNERPNPFPDAAWEWFLDHLLAGENPSELQWPIFPIPEHQIATQPARQRRENPDEQSFVHWAIAQIKSIDTKVTARLQRITFTRRQTFALAAIGMGATAGALLGVTTLQAILLKLFPPEGTGMDIADRKFIGPDIGTVFTVDELRTRVSESNAYNPFEIPQGPITITHVNAHFKEIDTIDLEAEFGPPFHYSAFRYTMEDTSNHQQFPFFVFMPGYKDGPGRPLLPIDFVQAKRDYKNVNFHGEFYKNAHHPDSDFGEYIFVLDGFSVGDTPRSAPTEVNQ